MRYQVTHTTTYEYQNAVSISHHLLKLTPRALPRQALHEHQILLQPEPALTSRHEDYFGNPAAFVTVEGAHRQLSLTARSVVDITAPQLPEAAGTPPWEKVRELALGPVNGLGTEPVEFTFSSPQVPSGEAYAGYASSSFPPGRPVLEAARDLMQRIFREFRFDPKATTVATPLAQVFQQRRGVCQDFAHFQIACLRSLGLPARYVSGYLETVPPPGKSRLIGADTSHAWLQVWCGEAGWADLDPTNGIFPTDRHITLAWGRDYGDVSPSRGVLVGSGQHHLKVAVDVTPVAA
jgi:transglutaminase-like putative cysteine protease